MDGRTGSRIHTEHPFAEAEAERAPVRRLRGRLASPVTLWTAASGDERAGLTVSSVLVVEPDAVLGVLADENDLTDLLEESGRFAVAVLDHSHRALADAFAFVAPAPGGPFGGHEWRATEWGPVLASAAVWAGCSVRGTRDVGYGRLVEGAIEHVEIAAGGQKAAVGGGQKAAVDADADPLVWHRGRYRHLLS
jgi:flavin reductase (DIM6/NTAB) family NADH-FMN oxidoreductase RutF